jgi:hypothetical protein
MALPPVEARGPGQLALRLRALRERQWPDVRLTQEVLARALGGDDPLSVATISSWESLNAQKVPPRHRLAAYATFFATRRSIEGATPRLLPEAELTADERQYRDELNDELLKLRAVAVGAAEPTAPGAVGRMWHFPDGAPVKLICAELPADERSPFADPGNPDFVELFQYADVDALIELFGHIRAENPGSYVSFVSAPNVQPDDLSGHVVLLGGVSWNDVTKRLIDAIDLPVRQFAREEGGPDIFVVGSGRAPLEFAPRTSHGGTQLDEDVGMLVRARNPINSRRTLTICNGVHTSGVLGAVRSLTDARLRDTNEAYLASRFGDTPSFGLLMRVLVLHGKAFSPDFSNAGTRLYEWPEKVT